MSVDSQVTTLSAAFDDYPHTQPLKRGEIHSPRIAFAFSDIKPANRFFKPMVRELKFDISEMAIATYLQAKAYGKPLTLIPATIMGRFQHGTILCYAARGTLTPADLPGKRVGVRSYSQTTVTWVRGMLAEEHGVDWSKSTWVTFEDGHLAEYKDPPNCERAAEGKEMMAMLGSGEVDAAVVGNEGADPKFKTLVPDPETANEAWCKRHGAVPVNHLVVVKSSLSQSNPEAVAELYRLLVEAKKAAGAPKGRDMLPFGYDALRPSLELAIEYAERQKLLPRKLTVDELFDERTKALKP